MQGTGVVSAKRRWNARRGTGWAAVLVFHRVSDTEPESGLTVSPPRFRAILETLRRSYRVLTASQFLEHLVHRRPFTGHEVLITFDDGYADNFELAAPILFEYQLPALFFLTAGFIGTDRDFWWDAERGVRSRVMTWEQARGLVRLGFDVGCHTLSHADLGREPISHWERELVLARDLLRDNLGVAVADFAYPFGGRENIRPEWLEMIRRTGFRSCYCGFGGLATMHDNPYWIPRMGAAHQRGLVDLRIDMDNAW